MSTLSTSGPAFVDFDVCGDFSIDTIVKELDEIIVEKSRAKVLIDPWGPGGGNTNVVIYCDDQPTQLNILLYMRKHGMGYFQGTVQSDEGKIACKLMGEQPDRLIEYGTRGK